MCVCDKEESLVNTRSVFFVKYGMMLMLCCQHGNAGQSHEEPTVPQASYSAPPAQQQQQPLLASDPAQQSAYVQITNN